MIITGGDAESNDPSNPVTLRYQELLYSGSLSALPLGYAGPVYYNWISGVGYQWWMYFSPDLEIPQTTANAMLACGIGNCPCLVYGPLFTYYDSQLQFQGPLGFPTSDPTTLPDGTTYSVFDNGVLVQDTDGNVSQQGPLQPSFVQAFTESEFPPGGIEPTPAGITSLAGQKVQTFANNAVQGNTQVTGVTTTTTFDQVGTGACMNLRPAGQEPQTGLARPYLFKIHFDMKLAGCAGIFGDANVDTTVTLRLGLSSTTLQGVLETYSIDNVGTPFGENTDEVSEAISNAFNNHLGQDLIGAALPSGVNVMAIIIDDGNGVPLLDDQWTVEAGNLYLYVTLGQSAPPAPPAPPAPRDISYIFPLTLG
jgi:hypothetical protein